MTPVFKTVTLEAPIKRGDAEISEVRLRKPGSGELRGLSMAKIAESDVDTYMALLPRISDPSLLPHELNALDPADLMELMDAAFGFFLSRKRRAAAGLPVGDTTT